MFLIANLKQKFGKNLKTIGDIAEVICGPFGSAIKSSDYKDMGIPLVRIVNISKKGYMNYDDLIYISEKLGNSLSRTQVFKNDIVISQRGSLGQCAIVDGTFDKMNISANIIAIKNISGISVKFLHDYICSEIGQTLLERSVSGQVQSKITTQDISNLPVPIGCNENKLSLILERACNAYNKKLQQAEKIVEDAKSIFSKKLGIIFEEYYPSIFSYSSIKQIKERMMFCNSHSLYLSKVVSILESSTLYVGLLEEYVDINPTLIHQDLTDTTQVSFVPMSNVSEKTGCVSYIKCDYNKVKTGFTPFKKGDLLWAKITPCMQNGKSFFTSNMTTEYGFGSTEFHVLRAKNDQIYMPFLWVLLSEKHILEAAQGMFSGSAGQQRVSELFLRKLPLVLPNYENQKYLADCVISAIRKSQEMSQEAEKEWAEAKVQFEKELLEG